MTTITHPDLARLQEVTDETDQHSYSLIESTPDPVDRIKAVLAGIVHYESLYGFTEDRAAAMVARIDPMTLLLELPMVLQAAWAEAFTAGVLFERRGGTTAPEHRERQ
jgi:hypothetical protein